MMTKWGSKQFTNYMYEKDIEIIKTTYNYSNIDSLQISTTYTLKNNDGSELLSVVVYNDFLQAAFDIRESAWFAFCQ